MNYLSNSIYQYYLEHFDELPYDKQFHFASRLYLWSHDPLLRTKLDQARTIFTHSDQPKLALQDVYASAQSSVTHGSKNASNLREPFFERYPQLKSYVSMLFRVAFMKTIYGIDARSDFLQLVNRVDLQNLFDMLTSDTEAVAILSTHAINFMYLYQKLIAVDATTPDPKLFMQIARIQYDHSDPIHLQLYIYLYTHCIIGESLFYAVPIPAASKEIYQKMLSEIDKVIELHFEAVNLDNKCEFLVCCRLVGYKSSLEERIYAEARQSVSNDGTYIVDRHNRNPQTANIDLPSSEHRNVLLIMSTTDPIQF